MQKTISILRGADDETYDSFHARIRQIIEKLTNSKIEKLHYTITLEAPPKRSVIPFSKDKIALVSAAGADAASLTILEQVPGYSGSFHVSEALPIAYEKNWDDGEVTPGVCLLTLFRQKKSIEKEKFLHRWFNGHTPLTLKIHPIYHYNRNEVTGTEGDPPVMYDGIVEEHCRTEAGLLNPMKFFAKSGFAPINMIKTWFDVKSFIDYKSIETYLVREYHVIS